MLPTNFTESFNFSDYDNFYNDNFDSQLDELFGVSDSDDPDLDVNASTNEGLQQSIGDDFIDFEDLDVDSEFVPLLEHEFVERFLFTNFLLIFISQTKYIH